MKKCILVLPFVLLFSFSLAAQQAKPSPATPKVAAPELKERTKPQSSAAPDSALQSPALQSSANSAVAPTLPVGTAVRMKLETPLYSASTKAGDNFAGRILEDIKLNEKILIPVGASLQGHVMQVTDPRRIKGKATIQLRLESVTLPNGQKYVMSAAVVDTNKTNGTDVDNEGRIKGPGHGSHDVLEVGAGTGAGALVGGLVGGGKGILVGAVIGAGGTMAHWLSKKNSAYLPAGSEIIFELSRPMTVMMSAVNPGRVEGSL